MPQLIRSVVEREGGLQCERNPAPVPYTRAPAVRASRRNEQAVGLAGNRGQGDAVVRFYGVPAEWGGGGDRCK